MNCRFCGTELVHECIDLVNAPPSNAFLTCEQLLEPEIFYPLKLYVCTDCFLVQIDEYKKSDTIFNSDYLYFSSFARSWLAHVQQYTDMMIGKYGYDRSCRIVEIASNDGYLLQYFKARGIPVLGIEPAEGTAAEAKRKGIETVVDFFGRRCAQQLANEGKYADLLIGNNVLAHVPDINDFIAGLTIVLKPSGIITMEFPHLMQLIDNCQFDTIYHEHYSYLSFITVRSMFERHGLVLFDVEELPTHGGSLRIYARHAAYHALPVSERVDAMQEKEVARGLRTLEYYRDFQIRANGIKYAFLEFLITQKKMNKLVAAYGAAAKGNTLLNYCGVKSDLVAYAVDASPHKQGRFLPGSHIPVMLEAHLRKYPPDYLLILPWNLREEITRQLHYIRDWGGRFVTVLPELEIF